jgi:hypothetical protein
MGPKQKSLSATLSCLESIFLRLNFYLGGPVINGSTENIRRENFPDDQSRDRKFLPFTIFYNGGEGGMAATGINV